MPLRPEDVVRKSFRNTTFKRGYDEAEVDAFLEEVVAELRRLHAQVDELEAARLRPLSVQQLDEERESERLVRERQQLELVRTERSELVAELAGMQTRLEQARTDVEGADARVAEATKAAEEAEARRAHIAQSEAETAERLQRLTHEHEVLREGHDGLVRDLRTLRLAAETRAQEVLGSYDPESLQLTGSTQSDDLGVIAALASRLHDSHVAAGEQTARELRESAAAESEQLLTTSRAEHDRLLEEGATERDRTIEDGHGTAQRLVAEAEEQRAGILGDLQARREVLEQRLGDLEHRHEVYVAQLRELLQRQHALLDDQGWRG